MKNAFKLVALLFLSSSFLLADSIVSIEPPTTNVISGDSFSVSVNVSAISDLAAFQFDLAFNPSVLSATNVTEGAFLSTAGSTIFFPGTIDNTAGTIIFNADTLSGPGPGANGSGILALISFDALTSGTSSLDLSNLLLLDSSGNDISFSVTGGTVTVGGTVPVPEPPSWQLLLAMGPVFPYAIRRLRSCRGA